MRPRDTTDDPDKVRDLLSFDAFPITVRDGVAYEAEPTSELYAPECYWQGWGDKQHVEPGTGWELLSGWSRQEGRTDSIMHASEFIGKNMGEYILAHDGYYTVVVCDVLEDMGDDDSGEPAGWAVAYKMFEEADDASS